MEETIEKLKLQHEDILKLLTEIESLRPFSFEFREKIKESKKFFLEHLRLEDEKIYPLLSIESMENDKLSKELSGLAEEMHEVTSNTLFFFDKFSNDHSNDETDFFKTFAKVKKSLIERIEKEETFIYEKFTELTEKKSAAKDIS